jgi:hypothetical protein
MPDKRLRMRESKQSSEFFPTANIEAPADFDDRANPNSADDVIGEIGLVLVIILGAVLAINMMLLALHIG